MERSGQVPNLSIEDAAWYMGLSTRTVHNLIKRGALPMLRGANKLRFTRASLDAYLRGEEVR